MFTGEASTNTKKATDIKAIELMLLWSETDITINYSLPVNKFSDQSLDNFESFSWPSVKFS